MRLDKFLKVSRVIKRRTVANEACDNGHVEVNGKVARASLEVRPGDTVKIAFGERTVTLRVLDVRDNVGKADASELYEVLEG
ncbi:MAG: RNA-binding S4 domain-containing protein [Clostridia bacterium]|nr:RNA-binding S4 domain-containing protein [Clostridia bacterium]MBR7032005.1 RNA-binding S4 domain-containing protein [Clostridia bacterium]